MANRYISNYTGEEVDESVRKTKKIPNITTIDNGKILQVNNEGNLILSNLKTINDTSLFGDGNLSVATKEEVENYICDEYSDEALYKIGDLVIYNNQLYRCITAINTPEPFTSADWTLTDINSEMVNLHGDQIITGAKTLEGQPLFLKRAVANPNYIVGYKLETNSNQELLVTHVLEPGTSPSDSDTRAIWKISDNLIPVGRRPAIGSSSYPLHKIYLGTDYAQGSVPYGKILSDKNPNYGLKLPDTTNFTDDKMIATTDIIPSVLSQDKNKYLHTNKTSGSLEWADATTVTVGNTPPVGETPPVVQYITIDGETSKLAGGIANGIAYEQIEEVIS